MTYRVNLVNPLEREAKIAAALTASTKYEDFYEFRNQKMPLKVIRIDVGLPIYRIENFRTYTDQKEYVVREKKAPGFFLTGQENESVQQLQHQILERLAAKG